MTAASGLFSCSHCLAGANASKIGAHTGSSRLFLSCANPMVGVCEHATAPMMLAMSPYSCVRSVEGHGLARKTRGAHVPEHATWPPPHEQNLWRTPRRGR